MSEGQGIAASVETIAGQAPMALAHLFTEVEAVKLLGAAEVAKHAGQRLYSLTRPLAPVALDQKGVPPLRVPLFAYGANESTKGTFYLTESHAVGVLQAETDYGNDLCIDLDHRALWGDSKAVGWFSLELDAQGLWAAAPRHTGQEHPGVWWLASGVALIESYEYRYISPVFWTTYDDQGREVIVEVINFSLTNIPATKNRAPLSNSRGEGAEGDSMNHNQNSAAPVASVTTAQPQAQSTPTPVVVADNSSVMARVHALTGQTDPDRINGVLTATFESASADKAALSVARKELRALRVKVAILEKKIPPAQRERCEAMSEGEFDAYLSTMSGTPNATPSSHVAASQPAASPEVAAAAPVALTKDEEENCARYKIDKALYAANKAKMYPRSEVATDAL